MADIPANDGQGPGDLGGLLESLFGGKLNLFGGGGGTDTPDTDVPTKLRGRDRSNTIGLGTEQLALLAEMLSSTGALDAFFQNIAAREDPTIPALINAQLQRFANQQNTGGFDANAFLGGDFSFPTPDNAITLGGGGGPFDIPLQQPGGVNPIIQMLLDNVLTPGFVDQLTGLGDMLFQFGSPLGVVSGTGGVLRPDPETNIGGGGDFQALMDQLSGLIGGGAASPAPTGASPVGATAAPPPAVTTAPPAAPGALPQVDPIQAILQGLAQPQVAQEPQSGAVTPILGRMALGGTVPQTGAFILEQGEQVLPPPGFPAGDPGNRPPTGIQDQPGPHIEPLPPPPPPPPVGGTPGTPPLPAQGMMNPLQQAIQSLLDMVMGGGPLQQNINDQFANQLQSSRRNVSEDFARRGLGGSGIEEQLQLQSQLGIQGNAISQSNALALQAAQALTGASLGAGQFGLQQQQLQDQTNLSMMEQLMRFIQGLNAPAGSNPMSTVNVI